MSNVNPPYCRPERGPGLFTNQHYGQLRPPDFFANLSRDPPTRPLDHRHGGEFQSSVSEERFQEWPWA